MLQPLKIGRQDGAGSAFTALINPAEIKTSSRKSYSKTKKPGTKGDEQRPRGGSSEDQSLSFSLTLDGTGAVPPRTDVPGQVADQLQALEQVVGLTPALSGSPVDIPFLKIQWGDYLYEGRLQSLSTVYRLFAADGTVLRARVDLSFVAGGMVPTSASGAADGTAREVRTQPGQSFAELCQQMYGDEVSCEEIAQLNGLDSLRDVPGDTALLMPGLAATSGGASTVQPTRGA